MTKAIWNGTVIAESEQTIVVDGYTYFPSASVRQGFLKQSSTRSACPWKGTAKYFSIVVSGNENLAAAWTYENPQPAASQIKGHVGFWRGVEIKR